MVDINWGLLNGGNNALQMFDYGRKIGMDLRERQREDETRKAMGDIYRSQYPNPMGDPRTGIGGGILEQRNALDPYDRLAQVDPLAAMKLRGQQQQQARQSQEQRRADLPLITRLIEGSTDEATYQQNRATAREYGIDVSTLPAQFDPAWRDQQLMTLKALQDPVKAEALSTAGKQAVDMGYKPGTAEFNKVVQEIWTTGEAKPYVVGGETRLFTPKLGGQGSVVGTPPPAAIAELRANPATAAQFDEIFGAGASARILQQNGGQTAAPSATFRDSVSGVSPVANGRAVISQLFPGARITQNRRDPNSALGRANPRSWHNRSGGAVDVAPIKGMTFEQYVNRVKQAGYRVIEARDEVKNPSGHATGPHWHIVIGEG